MTLNFLANERVYGVLKANPLFSFLIQKPLFLLKNGTWGSVCL
jgi:hypothetical protein